MDPLAVTIADAARNRGIGIWTEFDPALLIPEPRIRDLCRADRCDLYGKHYMCPPHVGPLPAIRDRLRSFSRGFLFQYSRPVDVEADREGVRRTKVEFHHHILELEGVAKREGAAAVWGMIGGSCALCDECGARTGSPCPTPEQARMSLESIGVDVLKLLNRLGLESRFHPDRITWTGCVLCR